MPEINESSDDSREDYSVVIDDPSVDEDSMIALTSNREFLDFDNWTIIGSIGDMTDDADVEHGAGTISKPAPSYPIIFIPGTLGTSLFDTRRNQLWPTGDETTLLRLAKRKILSIIPPHIQVDDMFADDVSVGGRVIVGEVLKDFPSKYERIPFQGIVEVGPKLPIYRDIFEHLHKNNGYTENKDLFGFPYDWRNAPNNTTTLNSLHKRILELTTPTNSTVEFEGEIITGKGYSRVIIITHSLGGVVARAYIHRFGDNKIEKLIMVGSPNHGSPKYFGFLLTGDPKRSPVYVWVRHDAIVGRQLAQHLPALYFGAIGHTRPNRDSVVSKVGIPSNPIKHVDIPNVFTHIDKDLFQAGEKFQTDIDSSWNQSIASKTHLIVGDEPDNTIISFTVNITGDEVSPTYSNGDATIPAYSANQINNTKHIPSQTYASQISYMHVRNIALEHHIEMIYSTTNLQTISKLL